jgi:hypothetical protein
MKVVKDVYQKMIQKRENSVNKLMSVGNSEQASKIVSEIARIKVIAKA